MTAPVRKPTSASCGGEQLRDFDSKYWVFHYTYQFETMLDGAPCQP